MSLYISRTSLMCGPRAQTSELLKFGCDLTKHFATLIKKIAKNETATTECIMLAITASRCETHIRTIPANVYPMLVTGTTTKTI